jgi:hypothetical protein
MVKFPVIVSGSLPLLPIPQIFSNDFAINGEMYKGSFALDLRVDRSEKSFRIKDVTLKHVNIEDWINDFGLLGRKVTGTANFSGEYQGTFANFFGGVGKGELLVVDGQLQLLQPVLSITDFTYERIIGKMEYEKGALKFIDGEVLGKEMKANFTGTLEMTTPFLASNMSLSGSIIPSKEFLAANPAEKKSGRAIAAAVQNVSPALQGWRLGADTDFQIQHMIPL